MRKLLVIAGILMSAITLSAHAGWYVGANANSTQAEYETALFSNNVGGSNGAGITLGYQATQNFGLELTHNQLGTASGFGGDLEYKANTTGLAVVARQPLSLGSYNFYGNARIGLAAVDAEAFIVGNSIASGNEISPLIGVGLQLPIASSSWSATAGAQATQARIRLLGNGPQFTENLLTYTVGIRKDF